MPFYELRRQALSAATPEVTAIFTTCEAAVRAVKGAKPDLGARGVTAKELKELKRKLVLPSPALHNNYAAMMRSMNR